MPDTSDDEADATAVSSKNGRVSIPKFRDGKDWTTVVFELELCLEQQWVHHDKLDIGEYLLGEISPENIAKADVKYILAAEKAIYYCLALAAECGSFAKRKIMAARHASAQPRVKKLEGLLLFKLLNGTFHNADSHSAGLPRAN